MQAAKEETVAISEGKIVEPERNISEAKAKVTFKETAMYDKTEKPSKKADPVDTDLVDIKRLKLKYIPPEPGRFSSGDGMYIGAIFFLGFAALLIVLCIIMEFMYRGESYAPDISQGLHGIVFMAGFGIWFLYEGHKNTVRHMEEYDRKTRPDKEYNEKLVSDAETLNKQSREVYDLNNDTLDNISFIQDYTLSD